MVDCHVILTVESNSINSYCVLVPHSGHLRYSSTRYTGRSCKSTTLGNRETEVLLEMAELEAELRPLQHEKEFAAATT